jgi:MFS family permease
MIADPPGQQRSEVTSEGVWTTIAAMIGLSFGPSTIAVLGFGVFIRPIEMEFGWTRTQVSLASTIISCMIVLVSPLQGILTDRFGSKPIILASIPVFSAGVAGFYFMPARLSAFYLMWAMIPVLGVGLWPLGYLRAVSSWFDRRLGLAVGIANAGIGIGSALVPLIAGMLIARHGWRFAYLGLAAVALAIPLPIALLALKERRPLQRVSGAAAPPAILGLAFRASMQTGTFRLLVAAYFLLGITNTALITQQIPLLMDSGVAPERAALVQSIFGVAMMIGRVGTGYLIDRIFAPFVMVAVTIGAAIACSIYASGVNGAVIFLCASLIGIVVGAEFDVLAFLIKRYFGMLAYGKLYGTVYAIFQFGCGLGVAFLPVSRGKFGSYAPGLYTLSVCLALSALVFIRFGPYQFPTGNRFRSYERSP